MAADPEAIYTEVLTEEQGKGVTPAVAEGRAKAARARAEHGSPHPKEPKWWPGAQPHLEGGDGAAAAEAPVEDAAPEPEPEPEPAPAAEAPAAEAPAADAAPAPSTEIPDAQTEPAAAAPAAAAPAQSAPAAPAAAPAATLPAGVTPGMPAGNRLRPEDSVGTDAQFDAQQAVYQRRKLIDDLVSTGVPAVSAASGSKSRSQPLIFLAYIAVVAIALVIAFSQKGESSAAGGGGGEEPPPPGGGITLTAANVTFDTDTLSLPADKPASVDFVNDDASSIQHNLGIYEEEGGKELFKGDPVPGGSSTTYNVDPLAAGTYYFQCDIHPGMNGSVEVK